MGLLTLASVRAKKVKTAETNGAASSRTRTATDVVIVALFFALLAGLFESVRIALLRLVLDRFTWLPPDAVWMAPVAYVGYLSVPAVVVALLVLIVPTRVPVAVRVFPFALVFAFSLALIVAYHHVSGWALALLAAGVAFQISRLAQSRWSAFRTLAGRGALVMSLATLGLIAGTNFSRTETPRTALDVPHARAASLNVLFIILDTVRAASLSLYGYARPTTPLLEQWARKGVVFENAFSPAPWTLPAHASMFTGRWPHELTADWERPFDRTTPTLAETLQKAGYETAGFTANLKYTAEDSGLNRGFSNYQSYLISREQIKRSSLLGQWIRKSGIYPMPVRKRADDVNAEFLQWLSTRSDSTRPFFVFLNYYDAHMPYRAPATFRAKLENADRRTGAYDAAIAYLDFEVDKLLRNLEKRGALENTLVIVTSDHGEMLGEHGLLEHGNGLYRPVLNVPLVMWSSAGIPANVRVKEPVTTRDVPSTILALTTGGAELPGEPLTRAWSNQPSRGSPILARVSKGIRTDPHWPVTRGGITSLLLDGWHYIRNDAGGEELYRTVDDPGESKNLVTDPEAREPLARLRAEMSRMVAGNSALGLNQR